MATVGNLLIKLTADASGILRGLEQTEQGIRRVGTAGEAIGGRMQNVFSWITSFTGLAVLSTGAVIRGFFRMAEGMREVENKARLLGIGVEQFQALQYVAKKTSTDFALVTRGIQSMRVAIAEAVLGDPAKANIFASLRLDAQQLASMGTDQAFIRVAQAIEQCDNAMIRLRTETELFGKSGKQIDVLLSEVTKGGLSGRPGIVPQEQADALAKLWDTVETLSLEAWGTAKTGAGFWAQGGAGIAELPNAVTAFLMGIAGQGASNKHWTQLPGEEGYKQYRKTLDTVEELKAAIGRAGQRLGIFDAMAESAHTAQGAIEKLRPSLQNAIDQLTGNVDPIRPIREAVTSFEQLYKNLPRASQMEVEPTLRSFQEQLRTYDRLTAEKQAGKKQQEEELLAAEEMRKLGVEQAKAEQEAQRGIEEHARRAQQLWEQTLTPVEKYMRQLEEINRLWETGFLGGGPEADRLAGRAGLAAQAEYTQAQSPKMGKGRMFVSEASEAFTAGGFTSLYKALFGLSGKGPDEALAEAKQHTRLLGRLAVAMEEVARREGVELGFSNLTE